MSQMADRISKTKGIFVERPPGDLGNKISLLKKGGFGDPSSFNSH
jgi:hypothetical protein